MAAPDGRLVIRRAPSARSPEPRYDVIDRQGRLSAVIRLPADQAIVGFGPGSVYTVAVEEFDLQKLRRHPWPEGS